MGRTSQEVGVMPRETVVPSQPAHQPTFNAAGVPRPSSEPPEPQHGLSVGWNKIGWVQIHMVPDQWESTGEWTIVDLDRASINRLIRTLRRARDAAYGADA
jgi:hypothetical protein